MIRWIVEGTLGTAPYSDGLHAVARVIDVRELADKSGNDFHALRDKVEEGVTALTDGACVVVACDFGVSRSNAIAAAILAKWKNESLDWAVDQTVSRTNEPSIKLDVIDAIRRAMFSQGRVAEPDRVLVTGGTGFLGRGLIRQLAGRVQLFSPGRHDLDLRGAATEIERICREHGIGQILHLAHPRIYTTNEALGESLTILKNLIDVCRVLKARLILPSGGVVFSGLRGKHDSVDQTVAPHPKGIYGETKYLQEVLVQTALGNGEIEATVVRISPTYGPGGERPRLIRYFYQQLLAKKKIVTHVYKDAVRPRLDLLYIDDAVAGLEKVINDRGAQLHHLGAGISYAPRDIAEEIAALLGKKGDYEEMQIDDYMTNVLLDSLSTRESLKWQPTVGLTEGLSRTIASFSADVNASVAAPLSQ